jgi:transposase-like protein
METEVALKEKPKPKLPSPEERLELVLLGLIREQTVENLCHQSGVSKALFYQWLRRGREGLLKALEAKRPGRKPLAEKTSPQEILELRARLKRMEQELASLRKEKDRYKLQTEVAQRVIQRNGWNPEPKARKSRVKKNGARAMKPKSATSGSGPSSESSAPQSPPSPPSGASAGAPTGGGSTDTPQSESLD